MGAVDVVSVVGLGELEGGGGKCGGLIRAKFGKGGRIDEQSADEGYYFSNNDDVLGTTDRRAQAVQSPFIRLRRAAACCVNIAFRRIHRSSVYVTNLSAT